MGIFLLSTHFFKMSKSFLAFLIGKPQIKKRRFKSENESYPLIREPDIIINPQEKVAPEEIQKAIQVKLNLRIRYVEFEFKCYNQLRVGSKANLILNETCYEQIHFMTNLFRNFSMNMIFS